MKYAVIPFGDPPPDLVKTIRSIDPDAYLVYAPKAYFVKSSNTTANLALTLGFSKKAGPERDSATGIVMPVKDFYGYANPELWTWLNR